MLVWTNNLNQAAMLLALGAKFVRLHGLYPKCDFVLQVVPWQVWYEKHIGLVRYKTFTKHRNWIKEQGKILAGKGANWTGKKDGFFFNEVVKVKHWTEKEKERLGIE